MNAMIIMGGIIMGLFNEMSNRLEVQHQSEMKEKMRMTLLEEEKKQKEVKIKSFGIVFVLGFSNMLQRCL